MAHGSYASSCCSSAMQQFNSAGAPVCGAIPDSCSTMPSRPSLSSDETLMPSGESHLNGTSTS